MDAHLASMRLDYKKATLNKNDVAQNPIDQFKTWWQQTKDANIEEPNAMTLSTLDENNFPDARIVLLKGLSEDGFTFFTNYDSTKGKNIALNPKVQISFFWKELERQVRIKGVAFKISDQESIAYFQSRPKGSQIGAWASQQSQVIANRTVLENDFQKLEAQYAIVDVLPKPPFWGGYIVKPVTMEFWQGRSSRLHDRLHYTLQADNNWLIERLSP
jgi:pyridoxamine 5'-phosphate oxidase